MRLSMIARRRVKRSVTSLVRLACVVALVGLSVFAASVFYPRPLVVIFSMSIGHVIGAVAVLLYALAVVLDIVRADPETEPAGLRAQSTSEQEVESDEEPTDSERPEQPPPSIKA